MNKSLLITLIVGMLSFYSNDILAKEKIIQQTEGVSTKDVRCSKLIASISAIDTYSTVEIRLNDDSRWYTLIGQNQVSLAEKAFLLNIPVCVYSKNWRVGRLTLSK